MANTRDVRLDTRFFCLFKGDPGTGKSIAAASFPMPVYFIDNDRRLKSVINFWRPRGREFENDHFDSWFQMNNKLEQLYHDCPFKTIVYDGITTGGDQILADMVKSRGTDRGSAKKNVRAGIELLQIEDYGAESRGLQVLIDNLKAISFRHSVNVIVTAHVLATESTDIVTKVTTQSRSLLTAGKKVAAKLPVHFDECYHFDVQTDLDVTQGPKYTVITHNVGTDWAKTALPLPTRINFTDTSLYDKIIAYCPDFVQPVNNPEAAESVKDGPGSW